jgi:hypothetical protein
MKAIVRAGLVPCLVAFIGACGRGEEESPTPEASEVVHRDPCALVTAAEVSAIRGLAVQAVAERDEHGVDTCSYRDAQRASHILMMVDAHWAGGRGEWQRWHAATAGAVRMIDHDEPGTDTAAILDASAGRGADYRFTYSLPLGGHLLKNDSFLWFRFVDMRESPEMFQKLADQAAARL